MATLRTAFISTAALAALASTPARAGLYTDDLSRCLVANTTPADKTNLVRWIFANVSLHPDVADLATASPELRRSLNQTTGQLFNRLLTVDCRKQTKAAVQFEGPAAFQLSFQTLGQAAMGSLMTHPAVA